VRIRIHRQWNDGKVEALAGSRAFGWMPYNEVKELAPYLDETTAPAGVTLIVEGQPNHSFFLLTAGILEATQEGRHKAFLHPGETCGAKSMSTRDVADETIRTVTPVRLLVASHGQYRALAHRMAGEAVPTPKEAGYPSAFRRLIAAFSSSRSTGFSW
jgi:CRP-like cAMP-binding protein